MLGVPRLQVSDGRDRDCQVDELRRRGLKPKREATACTEGGDRTRRSPGAIRMLRVVCTRDARLVRGNDCASRFGR